ncbi:hypothetical protein H9W90_11480 [Polaribacter pectinis]|uniref:Lipoprotein n=1 Tax=Polaribacter pectinis TaxID=2738844 RepID=A0A7G9L863_9FLAO|nr:hypothetical protein [Polaribacter pectinis]QNM84812.1 hypothetical protein H9W90_11480 [Polaribacter pectinis]
MKKISLLLLAVVILSSCLNNDNTSNYTFEYIAIDEAETPTSFTFGEKDTITLKYSLPSSCYSFDRIYYDYQDTTRTVAVIAFVNLDGNCTEDIRQEEYKLPITANQREDYLFKFYKGRDNDGKSIFEEVVIPVN